MPYAPALALAALVLVVAAAPVARAIDHCAWTAPDGSKFDLSALSRSPTTEANTGDWYQHAAAGSVYEYHLNVCANTHKVPPVCVKEAELSPAVAYQSKNVGHPECFPLGHLKGCRWELIDDKNPEKGVVVTYTGGARSPCPRDRQISYHFLCTHGSAAFDQGPYEVVEAPPCMYNVYWPTHHGCPLNSHVHSGGFAGGLKRLLRFVAYVLGAYFAAGIVYNVAVRKKRCDTIEVLPHGFFWGALGYTVVQGVRDCFPKHLFTNIRKEVVDGSDNQLDSLRSGGGIDDDGGAFGGGGAIAGTHEDLNSFDRQFPMSQPAPPMTNF